MNTDRERPYWGVSATRVMDRVERADAEAIHVQEVFAKHRAEGIAEHGDAFAGCYCDWCRIAREKNPALYNRPKCEDCRTEKKWDGDSCQYVAQCNCGRLEQEKR